MMKKRGQVLAVFLVLLAAFILLVGVLLKTTRNEAMLFDKKHDLTAQQYRSEGLVRELWDREQLRLLQALLYPNAFKVNHRLRQWDTVVEELSLSKPYHRLWLRRSDQGLAIGESFAKDPQGFYGLVRLSTLEKNREIFCDLRYRPCPASLTIASPVYTDSLTQSEHEYLSRVHEYLASPQFQWAHIQDCKIYDPMTNELVLKLLPSDKGLLLDGGRETEIKCSDGLAIMAADRPINLRVVSDTLRRVELIYVSQGNLLIEGYCHINGFIWLENGYATSMEKSQTEISGILWQPRKVMSEGFFHCSHELQGLKRFFRMIPEVMEPMVDGIYYTDSEPQK